MPRKGNMFIGNFRAEPGKRQKKTANPTKLGHVTRSSGVEKKWVKKQLSSKQEVLVECMIGEIYRYLIGPLQPKIRTGGLNQIMSEFVPYRSVRDVFDEVDHRPKVRKFAAAFRGHLDGFMRVLWSSIMLEENDLSDQNYGLAYANKTDLRDVEREDDFVEIVQADEDYVEFIKIDHGQSLNSLRIAKSFLRNKALAPAKHFSPAKDATLDPFYGVDKRTRKNRWNIWFTRRKYALKPYFVDSCLLDFLIGEIDTGYIWFLEYQPSTLPLFDGRLLSFFKSADMPDRYDDFEAAKYSAIAKLVFTRDEVYIGIADRASHHEESQTRAKIMARIVENKATLFAAIACDLDFCAYVTENADMIRDEITNSFARITSKRPPEQGGAGGASDRYGDLQGLNPIDEKAFGAITTVGRHYSGETMRDEIEAILLVVWNKLKDHDWKVTGTGGLEIPLGPNLAKKRLPETAAAMALSLMRFFLSPNMSRFRTLHDVTYLAALALQKKSFFRTKQTTAGYQQIKAIIDDFSKSSPAIRYFWRKYAVQRAERWIDLAALSREIDGYIRLNRQ